MTTFKTCFTTIKDIQPHPDPETTALSVATVYGFQLIIKKDSMKVGDIVFYIPIDAVLNKELESLIFPPESKIKLNNSRIRQIRIRRFPSQGLLVDSNLILSYLTSKGFNLNPAAELEKDLSELVDVKKFEPPIPAFQSGLPVTSARRLAEHPNMHSYNGLENLKWFPDLFSEGEEVVIQLKLHGTNARMGHFKTEVKTFWQKVKRFLGLLPEYHFRYGSNNVDITGKGEKHTGYYGEDIYGKAFKAINAEEKIDRNELVFGEIIGEGIQKGYHYGHKEPTFVLFDVKVFGADGEWCWLSPKQVQQYAEERGFKYIPVLYRGPYSKAIADSLLTGADPYYPQHKIREGIVIKSEDYNDSQCSSKKRALKYINPEYLDKDNSDFH